MEPAKTGAPPFWARSSSTRSGRNLSCSPSNARNRHPFVEERLKKLGAFADTFERNEIIMQDNSCGIITSGVSYQYARESFPEKSFLKLAMVYPLPVAKIRQFAAQVKKLYVFEELDPFFEDQIKALGIEVTGKAVFPICGEFNPSVAAQGIAGVQDRRNEPPLVQYLPPRPPNMCPGCPHRGIFYTLKKMKCLSPAISAATPLAPCRP